MAESLIRQNQIIPNVIGATIAVNTLGTSGQTVAAVDQSRTSITFHNPNVSGNVNIMVYQTSTIAGSANAPTFSAPGGGWIILPGGTYTFTGDVQGAWGAVAASGGNNGLTAISSRS